MTYAEFARASLSHMLDTLDHLVDAAQAQGLSDAVLSERLVDDMFPLELQLRVAINQVLLALNQVGSTSVALEEIAYTSLQHVRERIAAVRQFLDRQDSGKWLAPDAVVDLTLPDGTRLVMSAEEDMRDWILPNLYFHATMSYVLLRNAGLSIGKMDFMPHMSRYRQAVPS